MIIDAHTHVWPDAIAGRALERAHVPGVQPMGDGTVASLAATMQRAGVERSICLGVANTPDRVEAANRFAGELDRERFIGFGSIHADVDAGTMVDSLRRHGLRGAKVHPLYQDYRIDHPGLWETFDALGDEFVVIMHVGAGGDDATNARATPRMLLEVIKQFPRLKLVACHFGGFRLLDEAEELIIGQPVYLDTSWPPSLDGIDGARLRDIIRRHGADRVVFGSDWPMADPGHEIEVITSLGLDDDGVRAILGGNMAALLGL